MKICQSCMGAAILTKCWLKGLNAPTWPGNCATSLTINEFDPHTIEDCFKISTALSKAWILALVTSQTKIMHAMLENGAFHEW